MKKATWLIPTLMGISSLAHTAVLEEVVVTAQLRAENLQDVPVSVTAISGAKLMEAGLGRIEDVQAYVPNLTMSKAGISTDIFIRGIGSGANQGFDQSVGLYVDGVNYGKGPLFRAPFLDVERVEVLRGPQNILYGKSAIAGALSLTTTAPSFEDAASIALSYTPEFGERSVDLVLNSQINDTMAHRLAVRKLDTNGYYENPITQRDEAAQDELTVRYKVIWDNTANWSTQIKLEYSTISVAGRNGETILALPSDSSNPVFANRTWLEILDKTTVPILGTLLPNVIDIDAPSEVNDPDQDYSRAINYDASDTQTYNITMNNNFAYNDHQFIATTAYLKYDYVDYCDCDFTGADLFHAYFNEQYEQVSQEFRWVSPEGERFEFIGGVYAHYTDFYFFDTFIADSDIFRAALNALDLLALGARGDLDPVGLGGGAGLAPEEILGIGDAGTAIVGLRSPRDFVTEDLLGTIFLQTTYNITQALRLQLGLRYSHQEKEGARELRLGRGEGDNFVAFQPGEEANTVIANNLAAESHNLSGSRVERHFSPDVKVQYDIGEDVMTYASFTKGHKPGGYDARSNSSPAANVANPENYLGVPVVLLGTFEFQEEVVTSFEIGAKSTLFDGAVEFNITAFYSQYDDLQVSIFDGVVGFNVVNAASAISKGLEIDGRAALSESLIFTYSLGLLDFSFDDFELGTCRQGQVSDSPDGVHCDYSGFTNQYVADWSGNIGIIYDTTLMDRFVFRANADFVGTGDYNPSPTLDERVDQDGYIKINAGIALSSLDEVWRVALLGKNLTDEHTIAYASEMPLAYNETGAATWTGMVDAPRSFSVQLSYKW